MQLQKVLSIIILLEQVTFLEKYLNKLMNDMKIIF